jgi:ABC-2 type transport system ATP-binding protein
MKQRVKLAQALVHDPKLVLLDEPTNGLDPAGRDEMLGLIQRIGSEFSISVVVTSHLLGELERIADHIVVIEGGVLQRSTSTADATQLSGVVLVEVTDQAAEIIARLRAAGAQVADAGGSQSFTVELSDETVLDAVQRAVADLGVGLIRMQRRRHHLAEFFQPEQEAADAQQ